MRRVRFAEAARGVGRTPYSEWQEDLPRAIPASFSHNNVSATIGKGRAAARRHATQLAQKIGAADTTIRRIWGFGSVFDQRLPFRAGSDIDLAVEGGSIVAWKMTQQSEWNVDWVELDEQEESMVQSIVSSGVALYER